MQRCALGDAAALRGAVAEAGGAVEALCCAAAGGYVGLLRAVAEIWGYGLDVDEPCPDSEDGMVSLHHAARSGHAGAVHFLVDDMKADVNAPGLATADLLTIKNNKHCDD